MVHSRICLVPTSLRMCARLSASLAEMDLPLLPVEQPAFAADPTPYVEAARREHPWLAKSNVGGYVIHGYQAVKDILYMDDKLRPYFDGVAEFYGAVDTPWGRFMSEMMIARHGPDHARLRGGAQAAFTPRNVNRYRELMRRVISDLLDEWAPLGKFDFADFASYFPISVFCGLLGVSTEIIPRIRDALETQAASTSFDRDVLPAMLKGFEVLWNFADSAVLERERSGAGNEGLLDAMIAAKAAGNINETEIRQNLIMFVTAGYDTSKNMLVLIMYLMLRHPDHWERCAEDMSFCGKVVQEALRHSSIASVYRAVSKDFEYGDVSFPKGTLLFFLMGLAGRDPSVFPEPMEFRPDRTNVHQHMAFGRGAHFCIGMHLARAQLEEAVHLIAKRLTKPRVTGELSWRPYLGIWGLRTLPIEFEAAAR
jgi:cytochrome P450